MTVPAKERRIALNAVLLRISIVLFFRSKTVGSKQSFKTGFRRESPRRGSVWHPRMSPAQLGKTALRQADWKYETKKANMIMA